MGRSIAHEGIPASAKRIASRCRAGCLLPGLIATDVGDCARSDHYPAWMKKRTRIARGAARPLPSAARRALSVAGVAAALSAGAVSATSLETCTLDARDGTLERPLQLPLGTRWTYSVGADHPVSSLRLEGMAERLTRLTVGHGVQRVEHTDTYADVNPLRRGRKEILRFPLAVGAAWDDAFAEPGAVARDSGTYRYDYEEKGSSRVVALETIKLGIGRVRAYRIERSALWRKSNPRSTDMTGLRWQGPAAVEGLERSIRWYVPAMGRVVLKRSITAHPSYALHLSAESTSRDVIVTELVAFASPGGCRVEGQPIHAQRIADRPPLHYPWVFNDTWEFLLQRDPHVPYREDPAG